MTEPRDDPTYYKVQGHIFSPLHQLSLGKWQIVSSSVLVDDNRLRVLLNLHDMILGLQH